MLQLFKATHQQAKGTARTHLNKGEQGLALSSACELVEVWDQKRERGRHEGEGTLIVQTTHRLGSGREHTR